MAISENCGTLLADPKRVLRHAAHVIQSEQILEPSIKHREVSGIVGYQRAPGFIVIHTSEATIWLGFLFVQDSPQTTEYTKIKDSGRAIESPQNPTSLVRTVQVLMPMSKMMPEVFPPSSRARSNLKKDPRDRGGSVSTEGVLVSARGRKGVV